MTNPAGEVQRFNVVPGMTVENVQKNASKAEAVAIKLFDYNNDGIINEREAKCFNSYQIVLRKNPLKENTNQLSFFNETHLKTKTNLKGYHINYTDEKELNEIKIKDFFKMGSAGLVGSEGKACDMIIYNPAEKTLVVNGLEKGIVRAINLNSLEVRNSNALGIVANGTKNIVIKNTSDKSAWFNPNTPLVLDKEQQPNLIIDKESKIDIEY